MAEQALDSADVVSLFEQVSGEAVAEGVAAGRLGNSGRADGMLDRVLEIFLASVVAARLAAARIEGEFRGRKNLPPGPGTGIIGVFAVESKGEMDGTAAPGEIAAMQLPHSRQVRTEGLAKALGQESDPFPHAFSVVNGDLVITEIDVFDAQTDRFHEAQAAPIEQMDHEAVIALELGENGARLCRGENDGEFGGAANPFDTGDKIKLSIKHLLVKEKQSAKGLILGGGGDAAIDGEVTEEGGNLRFAQLLGVAFAMEEDEATNPIEVSYLCADAVVFDAQMPTDTIEQL